MKIVFFDGLCPMCHSWVRRVIRHDKSKTILFAPLESKQAEQILKPLLPEYLKEDTIIYFDDGKIYLRSDAGLQISKELNFPFPLLRLFTWVPKGIRDGVYNWIAKRRYKYGPRYDHCPLPPPEWRDRFIN